MYRLLSGLLVVVLVSSAQGVNTTLRDEARQYLKYFSEARCKRTHLAKLFDWTYQTNMTKENLKFKEDFDNSDDGINYKTYPWNEFNDADMLRQANLNGLLITDEVYDKSAEIARNLSDVTNDMLAIYSKQRVCSYKNPSICNLAFNPDLTDIFRTSRDPKELKFLWLEYHNQLGRQVKGKYPEYVKLGNALAKIFNYSNKAEQWIKQLEGPPPEIFIKQLKNLYVQLKPLYLQIHAFVRKRLFTHYGHSVINKTGPIPVHLIGSVTGDNFQGIIDIIKPYPNKTFIDITGKLKQKKYTVKDMAKLCDNFYHSLGLAPLPDSFWNKSQFEKPKGRNSSCVSSAWDMYDGKDYRILTCAEVNMDSLFAICHETGHLEYAINYKGGVCCYKPGGDSGINEGWADVASLSLSTTSRLSKLGFIDLTDVDHEVEINRLFLTALDKVAFLPYILELELWRYYVFQGKITNDNYNTKWWEMRLEYQGVSPPEKRSDLYLDVADKVHVDIDAQYITYFFAYIMQFHIQQALCIESCEYDPQDPETKPLSKCDIYGSKAAGHLLQKFFAMGASKPWQKALEKLTGQSDLDARPILNYFSELHGWLNKDNKRTGEVLGW